MAENDDSPDRAVIPMLFRTSTKEKDGNQLLIDSVDKLVIMNSKIAVRGSIIMNHLISYCISNSHHIPELTPALVWTAFSYGLGVNYQSNHLRTVSESTEELFHDPNIDEDGSLISCKGWMIDNLTKAYVANIKSSIRGKWLSVICNSINAHLDIHYSNPSITKIFRKNIFTMISKCITRPKDQTEREYVRLNNTNKEVIKFHRDGFGIEDDEWVNEIYFEQVVTKTMPITKVITHFANCLHRQCQLELNEFGGENCLKKQFALPMFQMGKRISINIDKKGCYFLVRQYLKDRCLKGLPTLNETLPAGGMKVFNFNMLKNG
jgi:hypothetical protein